MVELMPSLFFGLVGGLVRASVGLLKLKKLKTEPFKLAYLISTLVGASIVGLFVGLVIATDFKLSLLAGYAGTDFIESIYKLKMRQAKMPLYKHKKPKNKK